MKNWIGTLKKPMVCDLEEKTIKKRDLYKKKRDAQTTLLVILYLPNCISVRKLLSLSASIIAGFFCSVYVCYTYD